MALRMLPSTVSSQVLPRMFLSSQPLSLSTTGQWLSRTSSIFSYNILKPVTLSLNIPGLLSDIWDSVLRAVPKKKTSHMKKRHRQMAGKALKDVKSLSTCSGCGRTKRSHVLCPHCVQGMYIFIWHWIY